MEACSIADLILMGKELDDANYDDEDMISCHVSSTCPLYIMMGFMCSSYHIIKRVINFIMSICRRLLTS